MVCRALPGFPPARAYCRLHDGPLDLPYANAAKDADLIVAAGASAGLRLDVAAGAGARYRRTVESGHGDSDMAANYLASFE